MVRYGTVILFASNTLWSRYKIKAKKKRRKICKHLEAVVKEKRFFQVMQRSLLSLERFNRPGSVAIMMAQSVTLK